MRTSFSAPRKSSDRSASRTSSRAWALCAGTTASSRSKISESAPTPSDLSILCRSSPGTKSSERRSRGSGLARIHRSSPLPDYRGPPQRARTLRVAAPKTRADRLYRCCGTARSSRMGTAPSTRPSRIVATTPSPSDPPVVAPRGRGAARSECGVCPRAGAANHRRGGSTARTDQRGAPRRRLEHGTARARGATASTQRAHRLTSRISPPAPGETQLDTVLEKVSRVRRIGGEPLVILFACRPGSVSPASPPASRIPSSFPTAAIPTLVAPSDITVWEDLIATVVRRLATADEPALEFEVWNEPNLPVFWHDTAQAFLDTAAATHRAVRRVREETGLPIRIGGPGNSTPADVTTYVEAIAAAGLPLAFRLLALVRELPLPRAGRSRGQHRSRALRGAARHQSGHDARDLRRAGAERAERDRTARSQAPASHRS